MSEPARFLAERPSVRAVAPWHPLAHIARLLPRRIAALAADLAVGPGERVLDFGCADVPYRGLFPADCVYLAADLPGNPDATLEIGPDGAVPLPDAGVDAVLSTQVLEHVADPRAYLAECRRVLRPGGKLLLSTHGLMVWHPDPVDLWRWTCDGLRREVEAAGLEVVRFEGIMGLAATGIQLFQDAWYWRVPRLARPALALVCQSAAAVADRLERPAARDMNALVFALVARRP